MKRQQGSNKNIYEVGIFNLATTHCFELKKKTIEEDNSMNYIILFTSQCFTVLSPVRFVSVRNIYWTSG